MPDSDDAIDPQDLAEVDANLTDRTSDGGALILATRRVDAIRLDASTKKRPTE